MKRRLTLFTLTMSALLLVVTGVALTGVHVQRQQADLLTTALGPTLDATQSIRETMGNAQASLRGYLILNGGTARRPGPPNAAGDGEAQAMLRPYLAAETDIQQELRTLDEHLAAADFSGSSIDRGPLLAIQGSQREAVESWWAHARAARAWGWLPVHQLQLGDRLFADFVTANEALHTEVGRQRDVARVVLRDGGARSGQAILVATAAAVLFSLLAGWRTTVALIVPLGRLRDVVHRQRQGDRTAWARTDLGAAEMRGLAADVNALTAVQIRLLDSQAHRLALQAAAVEISRRIQDAGELATAFSLVAQGLGRALGADRVSVGVLGEGHGLEEVIVWTPVGVAGTTDVPPSVPQDEADLARRLWHGPRRIVVEDVSGPALRELGWSDSTVAMQPVGSLTMVAFGLTDRALGAITLRTTTAPRAWSDVEMTFVEQVAAELARGLAKVASERDRRDYIRRLEELDEHKDTFLSTVSHELRTPLTSILGYLEMLDEGDAGDLTDMQRTMLDIVGRNALRLRGLIEDLLVLNRMDTTTLASSATQLVDVADLLLLTCEELMPVAEKGGVRIVTARPDPADVLGDPAQLGRALANLLSNAIKFTPAGGTVRLSCHARPGDDQAEIVCEDSGIGIPPAEQSKLFNRFFRASNATSAQIPGTGLGLAIVRSIVQRHGGDLELDSAEGVGTAVRLRLPLASARSALEVA
ncbi:MAG TPA: ATP-binding protein [Dermatophilaceae bacterium]|nr:ATP-binding protein [Dermatophilaceae bacterium]